MRVLLHQFIVGYRELTRIPLNAQGCAKVCTMLMSIGSAHASLTSDEKSVVLTQYGKSTSRVFLSSDQQMKHTKATHDAQTMVATDGPMGIRDARMKSDQVLFGGPVESTHMEDTPDP